ncbi:MAG: hypothetical protein JO281_10635 [Pseudonocardiales bacterium]|nr:hypothetical protein [Pseudonocardiales bacterium]
MSSPVMSKGQRLAVEAAEAAEVRDALTHPDVVALRVERVRALVDRFIWIGMILGLLFTMTNVQQFTVHTMNSGLGSLGWWAAWLLDPTVSVILLGVLLAEREVSRWRVPMDHWARVAKWGLLGATYLMNTWESYAAGSFAGIVLHSVPVLAVFVGAEAVTSCNDALTHTVEVALTKGTERADRKAREKAERDKRDREPQAAERGAPVAVPGLVPPAPIPAPPVPAFRAVPAGWAGSATRTGPGRKRTGKPRTDAQLSAAVRELAAQTGGPPSQYAIKQRLGVGSGRAVRLLAELDTTPAGPPASNGAATPKDGAR